jgi:Ca-activated chloride channel family protein
LSEQTGGRAYFPRNDGDLAKAFAQIEAELRSQYLLAYAPTNQKRDGTYRKVDIEIVNPELQKDVKLTHRNGYFAKTGAKTQ